MTRTHDTFVLANQHTLLATGLSRLAGASSAAQVLVKITQTTNLSGSSAGEIITLIQNHQSKTNGHEKHMVADAAAGNIPSTKEGAPGPKVLMKVWPTATSERTIMMCEYYVIDMILLFIDSFAYNIE